MIGDRIVFAVAMVGLGFLIGIEVSDVSAKTADEKKWERIQKNREIRRANEQRYEACVIACMEGGRK